MKKGLKIALYIVAGIAAIAAILINRMYTEEEIISMSRKAAEDIEKATTEVETE